MLRLIKKPDIGVGPHGPREHAGCGIVHGLISGEVHGPRDLVFRHGEPPDAAQVLQRLSVSGDSGRHPPEQRYTSSCSGGQLSRSVGRFVELHLPLRARIVGEPRPTAHACGSRRRSHTIVRSVFVLCFETDRIHFTSSMSVALQLKDLRSDVQTLLQYAQVRS